MKKVLLQTQFGDPHNWTEQYFENVKMLTPYDWHLKVFTPNPWPSSGNIEIIPMTIGEFDDLLFEYCGVKPINFITPKGVPSKLVSDYYPAYGQIFQNYIKDFDVWGFTNWDMVYGRLDRFIPDETLQDCDIWSDDVNAINGIFTLMWNDPHINNLFRQVPDWEHCFTTHEPCAFDERRFTDTVRELAGKGEVRFLYPRHFPNHSYDRLIQHRPAPNLYFESDGALIERFEDPLAMPKGHYGKEIMSFHFSRTKAWPQCLQ